MAACGWCRAAQQALREHRVLMGNAQQMLAALRTEPGAYKCSTSACDRYACGDHAALYFRPDDATGILYCITCYIGRRRVQLD
jgi:hypothetical protein